MSFTLHLTFSGLCAFVPREEIDFDTNRVQTISAMRVLLPDARQGSEIESFEICEHSPRLRFEQPHGPDRTWNLDGERIDILDSADTMASDGGLVLQPSIPAAARMAIAAPGSEQVAPAFLSDSPPDEVVVASFRLTSGTLAADYVSTQEWEFRAAPDAAGHGRQRFASIVRVEVPIRGEEVILRSSGFAEDHQRQARLHPKPGRRTVAAAIENLCAPAVHHESRDVEADFAVYYRLSQDYRDPIFVPFRVFPPAPPHETGFSREVHGEAKGNPSCIFAVFAANELA